MASRTFLTSQVSTNLACAGCSPSTLLKSTAFKSALPRIAQKPVQLRRSGFSRLGHSSTVMVRAESQESASQPEAESSTSTETLAPVTITPPENFVPPEPKRFYVQNGQYLNIATSAIAPLLRLGTGVFVQGYKVELEPKTEGSEGEYAVAEVFGRKVKESAKPNTLPEKPLELYEFEGCPFCRKVREMVAYLDLDVIFYPCPQNGPNFRPKAISLGGKKQFPYLVDPNTGVSMYESDDIIKYLANTYGDGTIPFMLTLGTVTTLTAGFSMIGRLGKGSRYKPAKLPPQPLELWAYEPSPFCKVVREALNELELPHLYHSTARGSPKRQQLFDRLGRFQVPYLEDPNTGVKMFESASIVEYLYATYAQ